MREQFVYCAGALRGQTLQNVLEVRVWVMPIELGRLDEAGDRRGALSGR